MAAYRVYYNNPAHVIHYRFTCVKCEKTTEWLPYEIKIGYNVRVHGTYDPASLKRQEQAALQGKIDRIKKKTVRGHSFDSPLFEKTEYFYALDKNVPSAALSSRTRVQSSNTTGTADKHFKR